MSKGGYSWKQKQFPEGFQWRLTNSIICSLAFLVILNSPTVHSDEITSDKKHISKNNINSESKEDMLAEIIQAKHPRDLISNCKIALEKKLFLEEEFRSDEFLLRFTGGSEIYRFDVSLPNWMVDITVYPLSDKSEDHKAIGIQKATVSLNINSDNKGTLTHYSFEGVTSNSEFNVDLVRAVLGVETSSEPWYHLYNKHKKVHRLGNTCMHYKFQDEIYDKELVFYITWDGRVDFYRCTMKVFSKK